VKGETVADQFTATVVGGGIAGLASTVALAEAGWQVTVLEKAPAFGEVGAGLALTSNAMSALRALGLDAAARAAGHELTTAGYQDRTGRWLLRIPDTRDDLRRVTTVWGIHRQRLHSVLRQAAQEAEGSELITDAQVISVDPGVPGGDRAQVTYQTADGEKSIESDLIVAADGIKSAIRTQLFPTARLRYSGFTCWRAVLPDTGTDDRFIEVLGPDADFGALRISAADVYWYGYFRHPEGSSFGDELGAAKDRFRGWSARVEAIIDATTAGQLMRHDVYHLPGGLPGYVRGRVVITGDAAHAAVPTTGQGAASAIEDGVCVGRMIGAAVAAGGELAAALDSFDRARCPRCRKLARQSLLVGRIGAEVGAGWRQAVRNGLMRMIPAATAVKAGAPIVDWIPPPRPAASVS
jgi:2-polyprenyl-6-methoxyphenol hydroxylase-like FAD-dependent oxidoreductase